MVKRAEVRSTAQSCELRVNGKWMPSSHEEVKKLLSDGWVVLWNPRDYKLTPYGNEYVD